MGRNLPSFTPSATSTTCRPSRPATRERLDRMVSRRAVEGWARMGEVTTTTASSPAIRATSAMHRPTRGLRSPSSSLCSLHRKWKRRVEEEVKTSKHHLPHLQTSR